jgi:hypothetical protein
MKVGGSQHLCGCLSQLSTVLVNASIDTYEVCARQVDVLSVLVHCPRDVETIKALVLVGMVVGIAPIQCVKDVVVASPTAFIASVRGQSRSGEAKAVFLYPLREVVLRMDSVLVHVPLLAF